MAREIAFHPDAWRDYLYWQDQDGKMAARINALIRDCQRDPFHGIGKPEPLKRQLSGFWSRRIDDSNRLVYRITDKQLQIIACRYHYGAR